MLKRSGHWLHSRAIFRVRALAALLGVCVVVRGTFWLVGRPYAPMSFYPSVALSAASGKYPAAYV
ncbi:hypothetical protein J1B50_004288 [Escherichia coli]|nr:hypothetical protein [Escherichia coli]